jgi:hypothetical protein
MLDLLPADYLTAAPIGMLSADPSQRSQLDAPH